MKRIMMEFFRRGMIACGLGPLVLAVVYAILQTRCGVQMMTVDEVCVGILSLSALAFLAGGMNVIYQMERLPLMAAILIHGGVLYVGYLMVYRINGWLEQGVGPVSFFTGIFVLGYLAIWAIIYYVTKKRTDSINEKINQKRSV